MRTTAIFGRVCGSKSRRTAAPLLRFLLLFVVLLQATTKIMAQRTDEKDTPEKGDQQCPSLAERLNDYQTTGDSTQWLTPCEGETATDFSSVKVPPNGIELMFYASLPAYATDLGTPFSWLIVAYLNEASIYYDVKLSVTIDLLNATEAYTPPDGYTAEIVLHYVVPEWINQKDAKHFYWWQYRLIFECYYGEGAAKMDPSKKAGSMIVNEEERNKIKQDLNQYLRKVIDIVRSFDMNELSHGVLAISVGDPRNAEYPFVDGPPTIPPTTAPTSPPLNMSYPTESNTTLEENEGDGRDSSDEHGTEADTKDSFLDPTFDTPFDAKSWDWRRYFGLALFVGTLAGTVFLTVSASHRQRRRMVKEVWGNLGTEEGVDALLNTGWKVNGSKMEVYDKEGWGYTDDDSMFLGGYEQRHVGAEITVTHEDDSRTVTTPDSYNRDT